MSKKTQIIGFIKYREEIGVYRADYDAWVLDGRAYATAHRVELIDFTKRSDGRFADRLVCPIRRDDIEKLIAWFDQNAAVDVVKLANSLDKLAYDGLNDQYEENLPVVLYDFDERIAYENPDLNPHQPFDDYLPEGWRNIVVEGFDALVPDGYVYWSKFAARLDHRDENSL